MTDGLSLEAIAAELYALPPGEFIAARNERAKAADPDLAPAVKALRKPAVAAWVVNLFAQERAAQLAEALSLAAELREAQADLDAAAMSQLGAQRRVLTARLASDAATLARSRGEKVTDATLEAVRQTISAAFFDPDAAAAVASGRLVRDLEPSGERPLDLDAVVGGGAPGAPRTPEPPVDEVAERRRRRTAQKAVQDAEQARARAERRRDKADRLLRDAARRVSDLEAHVDALQAQLASARQRLSTARDEAVAAEAEHTESLASLDAAERDVRSALVRLDDATEH